MDALPQALRLRILSQAEGNPFFVEEVIRTLIDIRAIMLAPPMPTKRLSTGQISGPSQVGVRAKDGHTLVVHLATPVAYFLKLVGTVVAAPVPKHLVETLGASWAAPEHLVANGPYRLESCQPGPASAALS